MKTAERIQEDLDVLSAGTFGSETIRVTKARLSQLRNIERLAELFHDGLLDPEGLRRALEHELESE